MPRRRFGRLELVQGDITVTKADILVNAANSTLLGGGGVDGAIHRAAGPLLLRECRGLGGCPTGEVRTTGAYDLPAKWIVHAVGPVWRGGDRGEEQALRSCYRKSLLEAFRLEAETIAFPAISTGAYGYPLERAAKAAVEETLSFLASSPVPRRVVMVCFDGEAFDSFCGAAASAYNS